MKILNARFRSSEGFLEAYQQQFLHGGLFVATRMAHSLGDNVVLDVRFPELRSKVLVRGYVAWRRPARQAMDGFKRVRLRGGLGVEFAPSERRTRDFLFAIARGEVVDLVQRRQRRLPVQLDVAWRGRGERAKFSSHIDDIAQSGAFVRTREFMSPGSVVVLEITPPGGAAPLSVEGRVAWTHHTPGQEGMGIEFRCRDTGGARRLRELVRRIVEEPCLSPSGRGGAVELASGELASGE